MTTPDPRITPAVLEAVRGSVGSPGRLPDADCARVAAAVLAALDAPPMTPPTADATEALARVPAKWTPDCQGKQNYDGTLVCLSTRYWPRGGGFSILRAGSFETNAIQTIRPSATAHIYLGNVADEYYDEVLELARADFEGESEEEVKAAVEAWAAAKFQKIRAALLAALTGGTQ